MSSIDQNNELESLTVTNKEVIAARAAFFIPGFAVSTWAPLIPLIKNRLALGADVLGLLLLCIGLSAFVFMPFSSLLCRRLGCRRLLILTNSIMIGCVVLLSLLPAVWCYALTLIIFGAAMGTTDVTMNMNAVLVEKLDGRRLMSGMHAFWSVGCFCAAGLFSLLASYASLGATTITLLHAGIMLAILLRFSPHWLQFKPAGGEKSLVIPKGIVIVIGALACISFLVEGAIMDWSGVFLTEQKSLALSLAGTGYAIYSVAMLVMRLIGDKAVQLIGEQKAVICGSLLMTASFALLVWADSFYLSALAFIGIGIGCSNIVPVFYSILKYQQAMPISAAVTAITSLGYSGVILGPALLGFIAHGISISAVFEFMALLMLLQSISAALLFRRLQL